MTKTSKFLFAKLFGYPRPINQMVFQVECLIPSYREHKNAGVYVPMLGGIQLPYDSRINGKYKIRGIRNQEGYVGYYSESEAKDHSRRVKKRFIKDLQQLCNKDDSKAV